MRTKGNALVDKVKSSLREIDRLALITYQEEDYSDCIKSLGGEIEKFLKSTIFQGTKNKKNFNDLINELSSLGVQQQEIDYLHDFRNAYNSYKHNPAYTSSIDSCREILVHVLFAIESINALGLGIVNQPYQMQSQRFIWLAGWDDYRGGMTEVSLFIPDRSCDFPPAIEHFNIDYTGWYPVIEKYETSGELVMGKENIPENIYNIWERAGDFMGAGIYKGDIAELVKDLSSHISVEKESELLPDLKRKNDFHSVKSAIVFSLFDALKEDLWKDFPDLIDEIKLRASYDYGIDIESVHAKGILECFIEEAFISNRHLLRNVTDIIWTDSVGYEKCMNKVEICKQLYVSFDSTDKLIVRIR